jgi:hypothetical protein
MTALVNLATFSRGRLFRSVKVRMEPSATQITVTVYSAFAFTTVEHIVLACFPVSDKLLNMRRPKILFHIGI